MTLQLQEANLDGYKGSMILFFILQKNTETKT
jgi:hypothetical protein